MFVFSTVYPHREFPHNAEFAEMVRQKLDAYSAEDHTEGEVSHCAGFLPVSTAFVWVCVYVYECVFRICVSEISFVCMCRQCPCVCGILCMTVLCVCVLYS